MIVVDTNVIAYLLIPGEYTEHAKALLRKEPEWAAPLLWRSEFLNVLAKYINASLLTVTQSMQYFQEADFLLSGNQFSVSPSAVLQLVAKSSCTAYDCEYVALAAELGEKLVTSDRKLLQQFPEIAVSLQSVSG